MLVLSRKLGEKIFIGDNICITVVDIDRGKIRLGIEAPSDLTILRGEIVSDIAAENQRAGATGTTGAQEWLQVIGGPRRDEP